MKQEKTYAYRFQDATQVQYYEDKEYAGSSYYALMWELEKEILKEQISELRKIINEVSYLDFACGTGRIISFIEKFVDHSLGVDISQDMLDVAKNRVQKSALERRDILKNSITGKYDLVTAFRFFLNTEQGMRDAVFKSLRSNLKPTSRFVFNIHGNKFSFRYFSWLLSNFKTRKLNQLSYFEVKRMLEQEKLRIVNVYGVGFLPKVFYRIKFMSKLFFAIDRAICKSGLFKYISNILVFVVETDD